MTEPSPRRSALPQIIAGLVVGSLALVLALWGVPLAEIGEA